MSESVRNKGQLNFVLEFNAAQLCTVYQNFSLARFLLESLPRKSMQIMLNNADRQGSICLEISSEGETGDHPKDREAFRLAPVFVSLGVDKNMTDYSA